ncbi:MAG: hypothetical protein V1753_09875 [Pseudomonadota bacterium]
MKQHTHNTVIAWLLIAGMLFMPCMSCTTASTPRSSAQHTDIASNTHTHTHTQFPPSDIPCPTGLNKEKNLSKQIDYGKLPLAKYLTVKNREGGGAPLSKNPQLAWE